MYIILFGGLRYTIMIMICVIFVGYFIDICTTTYWVKCVVPKVYISNFDHSRRLSLLVFRNEIETQDRGRIGVADTGLRPVGSGSRQMDEHIGTHNALQAAADLWSDNGGYTFVRKRVYGGWRLTWSPVTRAHRTPSLEITEARTNSGRASREISFSNCKG